MLFFSKNELFSLSKDYFLTNPTPNSITTRKATHKPWHDLTSFASENKMLMQHCSRACSLFKLALRLNLSDKLVLRRSGQTNLRVELHAKTISYFTF